MGLFTVQFHELETLIASCPNINSKSEKSSLYSTLLQLQEHSTTDPSLLQSLADSSHVLLSSMANDISDEDEEIAAQALKCMGFMIYHPSIVTGIFGDDADMVLSSLQKVILSTRTKSVCNLGVWCISVQQLNPSFLNTHIDSLVRAIVHALDNPTGSLSTTFEAMQAVMKLVTQLSEKMRETSHLWTPPIYRRLVSTDKREKDMSERCLLKIKSTICPPLTPLSKAVIVDVKRKLLSEMDELLKKGMKIQAMQAWGWFTCLIGPYAIKNRHLINQLLKIPEQTFSDSDPQVKIASQIAWEALIDALIILPTQQYTTNEEINGFLEANRVTKSIKLIMTPLIGIMSSKCDSSVHLSCLNTWNYLLHKLDTFVNHPSIIKTVLHPMLETVFRVGPGNRNIWSWNFCLDLINSHAGEPRDHRYAVKWTPWNLDRFDFFIKTVHVFISHGEVAYDSALKLFRSALKGVQLCLKSSGVSFSDIMSCIETIITCLKTIFEGQIGQTFLELIEIVTEELQPSILGSPLYKLNIDDKNMVSPVAYLVVLYFHEVVKLTSDSVGQLRGCCNNNPFANTLGAQKLSSFVSLLLVSYDPYDILDTIIFSLYKYTTPNCLNFWIIIANCVKDYLNGNKIEPEDTWYLIISRFLSYPFAVFLSISQKKLDVEQILEPWIEVYKSFECCESLFPVFDRFLEEYSKVDQKTHGHEFLSLCGDAMTCVLEHISKPSHPCQINNDVGDDKRFRCTKASLECAARFLSVSYVEAKANPEILDTTSRVFSTLIRVVESFNFDEITIPFIEIMSIPLLQWLSDHETQHENTNYQFHNLWITTLKYLQTRSPPINFNSTFLKLQSNLLEATLNHPNSSISNPTITFWNSTYGAQINLDYPQNLLPVLDKLFRNGKINLGKKGYSKTNSDITPPQKQKVTTTLNRCVKRVELVKDHEKGLGYKRKRLELTEHQKEVRRAQQGRSRDCEGRGPGVRTYTSVDFSQGTEDESQESQDLRNTEAILEMLKRDGKMFKD
ncbi:hypothetical protein L2E82_03241 [Cichorium intybus]|uniref:Uncharacterized protein n=1 Tax=Cichorium intybus TaxID=13427 RepID=A0ACB9H451_CICIN|nr:hypothetical protein L2E82_03241 [Cichorium intybus]